MTRHLRSILTVLTALALLLCLSAPSWAQSAGGWSVRPLRLYAGVMRSIPVEVRSPSEAERQAVLGAELELKDPATGAVIGRVPIDLGARSVDLSAAFPVIWTARAPRVLYCQLYIDNEPVGAPLVVEPLLSASAPPQDELERQIATALGASDLDAFVRLVTMDEAQLFAMRGNRVLDEDASSPLLSGVRVYAQQRVVLETTFGPMTLRLRPDAAPVTARRFLELVRDGYYTDIAFHRIVRADERGRRVLAQTGDPTGTGAGTSGEFFDYEPSTLRHGYGVISAARDPSCLNTNGAQFFVCLSDIAGVSFDGRYTAFAEIVDGADALEAIVRTPLGLADPDDPTSPRERPLEPALIRSARLIPAPPLSATRFDRDDQRIRPEDQSPVVR